MFIGDHGKVIELKHIRWFILATMILLAAAIIAAVTLFIFNQKLTYTNKKLQKSLETSQARLKKVRQETDLLMAQLVLAKAKTKGATKQTSPPEGAKVEPVAETPTGVSPAPPPAEKTVRKASEPKPVAETNTQKAAPAPVKAEAPEERVMVEIDNLKLTRPEGSGNLKLEFKLRNVSPKPNRIEGRVIAILKGDDLLPKKWLTIPRVKLQDGKPAEKKGYRFAINNWRTMRMRTGFKGPLERYNLAEIFVYASDGEVLLREVHPITPQ